MGTETPQQLSRQPQECDSPGACLGSLEVWQREGGSSLEPLPCPLQQLWPLLSSVSSQSTQGRRRNKIKWG